MAIQRIKYANKAGSALHVVFADGREWPSVPYPGSTWHVTDHIQPYLDAGGTIEPYQTDAERLEEAVADKKREMKQAMDAALAPGFTCSNGIKMDAYQKDGASLDQGVRLAQKAGATEMVVRDYDNVRHTLPITEADQMVLEVGNNWLTQWQHKNDREEQVGAIKNDTSKTVDQRIAEIQAVEWGTA